MDLKGKFTLFLELIFFPSNVTLSYCDNCTKKGFERESLNRGDGVQTTIDSRRNMSFIEAKTLLDFGRKK